MSRQIDLTDLAALSDEDKQYLRDRGNPAIVEQLDALDAAAQFEEEAKPKRSRAKAEAPAEDEAAESE
jgi:hypothetical protein